jgi:hypothetical protein
MDDIPSTSDDERITSQIVVASNLGMRGAEVSSLLRNISRAEGGPADITADDGSEPQLPSQQVNMEIVIRELPAESRQQYVAVYSDVVERVVEGVDGEDGELRYRIEFADGREDLVGLLFLHTYISPHARTLKIHLWIIFLLLYPLLYLFLPPYISTSLSKSSSAFPSFSSSSTCHQHHSTTTSSHSTLEAWLFRPNFSPPVSCILFGDCRGDLLRRACYGFSYGTPRGL